MKACRRTTSAVLVITLLMPQLALANDGAAEIAAGGVLLRSERRVSMRKERLRIARLDKEHFKVTVEYEFVNESPEDVSTDVAFPVPQYVYTRSGFGTHPALGEFRAWVDGSAIHVTKETKALVGGRDYGPFLRKLGIDIPSFGHFYDGRQPSDFEHLRPSDLNDLVRARVVDSKESEFEPLWQVAITWHWKQRFPAGKTVRVKHEYTPSEGAQVCGIDLRESPYGDPPRVPPDVCLSTEKLVAIRGHECVTDFWVKYILTTANTWKTPIADFELMVDAPLGIKAAFCWDGPIERVSKTTVRATAKDFVPMQELTVHFF